MKRIVFIAYANPAVNSDLSFSLGLKDGQGKVPFVPTRWRLVSLSYTFTNSDLTAQQTILRFGTPSNTGLLFAACQGIAAGATCNLCHLIGCDSNSSAANGTSENGPLPDLVWHEDRSLRLASTAAAYQLANVIAAVEFSENDQ